jgi:hypothetical protein
MLPPATDFTTPAIGSPCLMIIIDSGEAALIAIKYLRGPA